MCKKCDKIMHDLTEMLAEARTIVLLEGNNGIDPTDDALFARGKLEGIVSVLKAAWGTDLAMDLYSKADMMARFREDQQRAASNDYPIQDDDDVDDFVLTGDGGPTIDLAIAEYENGDGERSIDIQIGGAITITVHNEDLIRRIIRNYPV